MLIIVAQALNSLCSSVVAVFIASPREFNSFSLTWLKGRGEVRGLDRRVVETKSELSRRGAKTTMGHVGGAIWWSYSYSDGS